MGKVKANQGKFLYWGNTENIWSSHHRLTWRAAVFCSPLSVWTGPVLSASTEEGGQLATSLNTPVGLEKGAPWQLRGGLTTWRAYLLCLCSHINGSLNSAVVWVSNGFLKNLCPFLPFVYLYRLKINDDKIFPTSVNTLYLKLQHDPQIKLYDVSVEFASICVGYSFQLRSSTG